MNIEEPGFCCTNYDTTTNAYNKRGRAEELPLAQFFKRVITTAQPLVEDDEELVREVRELSFKRGRDDEEKPVDDDKTALKKPNTNVTEEKVGCTLFRKRTREEEQPSDISLEDLIREEEEAPFIEEVPEVPPTDAFKSNQLALQLLTHNVFQNSNFILACTHGNLPFIKKYIIKNCVLLTELNQGIFAKDFKINPLLDGFIAAIMNNKSEVVDFFLRLNAVRKNVHLFDNLPLRTAFSENRLTLICKLLQVPSILGAVTENFIKSNVTRCAKEGHLFQFILLACLPHAENAFIELGYNYEVRSIFYLITQCADRFPKFAATWKEFLETDFMQISDDGPIVMVETSQVLAFLKPETSKQGIPVFQLEDDLPDLSNLYIN